MMKRFWHSSYDPQYSRAVVHSFVNRYGNDILIGGDPGFDDDFDTAMNAVNEVGAKKHVYLVGPGMLDWSAEERKEIEANARSVGIDTNDSDWNDQWYKQGGWEKKVHKWFLQYNKQGYYSAEIDNLDGVWDNSPSQYVRFINRFAKWRRDNKVSTKLMVKNLSVNQLQALIDDDPEQNLLAEWGMFEEGSGDPNKQIELAAKLGIMAVTPINGLRETHTYGTDIKGIASLQGS